MVITKHSSLFFIGGDEKIFYIIDISQKQTKYELAIVNISIDKGNSDIHKAKLLAIWVVNFEKINKNKNDPRVRSPSLDKLLKTF